MNKTSLILGLSLSVACGPTTADIHPPSTPNTPPVQSNTETDGFAGCTVSTFSTMHGGDEEGVQVYDERGRLVRSFWDTTNDFMPPDDREYVYNDDDQLIHESGIDEWRDKRWEIIHTYNERGLHILTESTHPLEEQLVIQMTYTDDDLLLNRAYDYDGDGEFEQVVSYVYNDRGQWIEQIWTNAPTNQVVQVTYRTHDAAGRLTHYAFDSLGDGTIEGQSFYTYSFFGVASTESHDMNGDDVVDGSVRHLYHANGQIERSAEFHGAIELDNLLSTVLYTYNEKGWLIEVVREPHDERVQEAYKTIEYDCES
jgi:hypothetical protein